MPSLLCFFLGAYDKSLWLYLDDTQICEWKVLSTIQLFGLMQTNNDWDNFLLNFCMIWSHLICWQIWISLSKIKNKTKHFETHEDYFKHSWVAVKWTNESNAILNLQPCMICTKDVAFNPQQVQKQKHTGLFNKPGN